MFSAEIESLATGIIEQASSKNIKISTAESCTGGLIVSALTEISGSSKVVECGYVTYSNEAKMNMLNVKKETLERYGAVSEQTVTQMAKGAAKKSSCNIVVAVSGIAGPTGGSDDKPLGLVHFGFYINGETVSYKKVFKGNRSDVRIQTVQNALNVIYNELNKLA